MIVLRSGHAAKLAFASVRAGLLPAMSAPTPWPGVVATRGQWSWGSRALGQTNAGASTHQPAPAGTAAGVAPSYGHS